MAESTGGMMDRVARHVAAAEEAFSPGASARWAEEFARALRALEFLPNSPTLMNAGTSLGMLSACFVLPVEDSLDSLFTTLGANMAVLDVSARVTGVPVVDDEGRLVRTVTEPDLLLLEEEPPVPRGRRRSFLEWFLRPARFAEVEGRAGGLHAEDVMTKEVVTVGPDTTVREAVRVLLEAGVKRLPVLDEGRRVVGIVSRGDLLGPFLRPDEELEREVREDVVSREEVERCRGW